MIDERKIEEIVTRVLERLGGGPTTAPARRGEAVPEARKGANIPRGTNGVYADADAAAKAARKAFEQHEKTSVETKVKMVEAMRKAVLANNEKLSQYAVEESGLGRYEDKLNKNKLVAEKTPGVEILKTVAYTGDHGLMLTDRAPYGVILAITPTTNPTETILCNAIGMIAAGNAVVFNVHPSAAQVCNWTVHILNEAIQSVGGPRDVLVSVEKPTIESANTLMKHPLVRLIVVTGGPAVVKAAMNSGKKAIGAGPGNPPALVDETANLAKAADAIVRGASLDNNIVCIAEKEIIAVDGIANELIKQLEGHRAYRVSASGIKALEKTVLEGDHVNKDFIGKNAGHIAKAAGIGDLGNDVRILLCETDEQHPFVQHELLMPVIPLFRVRDVVEGITAALRVEHGFHHTATMHSQSVDNMTSFARVNNCSIFVKNGPSYAGLGLGGEGYTSFTIASPTGEGLTTAVHFSRERRCTIKEAFRFV